MIWALSSHVPSRLNHFHLDRRGTWDRVSLFKIEGEEPDRVLLKPFNMGKPKDIETPARGGPEFGKTLSSYYPQERSGYLKDGGFGLIHVYYGSGVGKTTRAVGLAVRAAGEGLEVHFVQFMKSAKSGETASFAILPNVHYWCPGEHPFILSSGPLAEHFDHAGKAITHAFTVTEKGAHLLICDEILDTLIFDLLRKEQILELIAKCKGRVELVMTGRSAPEEILDQADYATEFVQVKHPYYTGSVARKGIEF
jgi:cob(I)alamin adenosyltransferase